LLLIVVFTGHVFVQVNNALPVRILSTASLTLARRVRVVVSSCKAMLVLAFPVRGHRLIPSSLQEYGVDDNQTHVSVAIVIIKSPVVDSSPVALLSVNVGFV